MSLPKPKPDQSSAIKTDTLAMSMMLVIGMSLVQRGLGFVREILLCRWLDDTQLGQWSMAFVFLMSASAFVTLGIQGSMNRYVERYRRQGRLRSYLWRVATISTLLAVAGALCIWWQGSWFSKFIFGSEDCIQLVWMLAVGLVVIVGNHFLIDLFTALRLFRVVTVLQFCNGIGFVVLSISLLTFWRMDAISLIIAFSLAMLISACIILIWQRKVFKKLPVNQAEEPGNRLWSQLLICGLSLWAYNLFANLFLATDRYMIIHYSGMNEIDALAAVGNYHSARVLPLLLATFAGLIAATLMPHLSHAWEKGRKQQVSQQTCLTIKLVGLGLTAAATIILCLSPLIFDVAFKGKYPAGLQVLPWVLVYCTWYGMSAITSNYLWCAEKLSLCGVSLAIGVLLNISLNLMLLPMYGLLGAVIATVVAHGADLALMYYFSRRYGLAIDRGVLLISFAPLVLIASPLIAVLCTGLIFVLAIWSNTLFNSHEQQIIFHFANRLRELFKRSIFRNKLLKDMNA